MEGIFKRPGKIRYLFRTLKRLEKHYSFVVDEFFELVQTIQSLQ